MTTSFCHLRPPLGRLALLCVLIALLLPRAAVSAQGTSATATAQQSTETPSKRAPSPQPSKWIPNSLGDILSVLTLLVTALFLFYTIKTWREMVRANDNAEKSNEENDRNTTESLRLTRETSEAALQSMTIAASQRDTLASALRAWLALTVVEPWKHDGDKSDGVLVVFTNTGFSPALAVHAHGSMKLAQNADSLEHGDKPCSAEHEHLSTGFIGPGATLKFKVATLELSQEQKTAVTKKEVFLYIYGCIDYIDAFGAQRRTLYASLYEPGMAYWTVAAKHNDQT